MTEANVVLSGQYGKYCNIANNCIEQDISNLSAWIGVFSIAISAKQYVDFAVLSSNSIWNLPQVEEI